MRIAVLLALLAGPAARGQEPPKADEFVQKVRPIVQKYCVSCHGPEKKKGDLDLSTFKTIADVLHKPEVWKLAVEKVNAFEMPPKGKPEPSHDDKAFLNKWLEKLPTAKLDCSGLATDRNTRFYKGYVMSRRLNRAEYENSVRDLLGLDLKAGRDFPADGAGGEGFDTNGDTLFSSPILVEKALDAADRVLEAALKSPEGRRRLGLSAAPSREDARRILRAFAGRAFRRPVAAEEVERLLPLYDRDRSLKLALTAVLVSPHFLFLVEPEPPTEGVIPLGPFPLAARLSYFLWSSTPDEALAWRAAGADLAHPESVREEVRRLLRDPRSRALGDNFALQWLELDPLGDAVKPDPKKFPEFDAGLAADMKEEVVHLFHEIVRDDRSLLELLDARHTWVNERLAKLYGIDGVKGPQLRRIELQDGSRGGLLGMAAVHAVSSYPFRTSPVLRGKWILESLLGSKVPPPPPGVITLSEEAPEAGTQTLRQRLEKHRLSPDCASCHDRMDPLGFGLENFDVLGRWRTEDNGLPVDVAGTLPSGEKFQGAAGLKKVILARKDEVMRHLARKMLGYALGRALNKFDECVVDDAMKALKANGYRASALIETIALSYPFRHRYVKK
jgi:hypothetical protein